MHHGERFAERDWPSHRLYAKYAIMFFGPLQFSRRNIPCPTADMCEALGIVEVRPAFT
jgi:hypothetical protein